ncbi:MAG: ATP-binding cassette domain-containing protein [Deltaproteobacteria bacterium]|nr:ATP-binding cassette domain-containing protein [Deltaproteobacteria bacterium]
MTPPARRRPELVRALAALDASGLAAAALDLSARGLLPAALLLVTRGAPEAGWRLALVTQLLVVTRGALAGRRLEAELVRSWSAVLDAAARQPLAFLRLRATGRESPRLMYAALRCALVRASVAPRLLADLVGLGLVGLAVLVLLGPRVFALGALGGLAVLPLALRASRRVRRVERAGFEALEALIGDAGLLVDGALEVRAHAAATAARRRADEEASRAAAARRSATRHRSLLGLLPVALGVVAATSPPVARLLQADVPLATVALLGGSALAFASSLLGAQDELAASEPQREHLGRFLALAGAAAAPPRARPQLERGWLRQAPLWFDAVSVRHEGNPVDSPHAFSWRWNTTGGLALVGPNGAGKSTLVAALLGLVPVRAGALRFGDAPWSDDLVAALRERTVLVPQRPYTVPSRSIRWHLRLFSPDATEAELLAALEALDLRARLEVRAPGAVLDVPAGELSGGELARMHLARIVLPRAGQPAELIVVDEPEAGLDAEGRRRVRDLLEERASAAAVILVAHDDTVVPEGFLRARCQNCR